MDRLIRALFTTTIYAFVIIPSVLLTARASKYLGSKNHMIRFFLDSFFAIMIPCVFSSLRGENVGVDVLVYAKPVFVLSSRYSSLPALFALGTRYELGYLALGYISSHVFHSFSVMLFFTQLLCILPVYISALKLSDKISAWSIMLSYYCMFYIASFNIMRESIAVSFVFLSFVELYKNKKLRSIIVALLGTLFHSSAPVGYALIVFVFLFHNIKGRQLRAFLLLVVTAVITIGMNKWTDILSLLANKGIVAARYLNYIDYISSGKTYLTRLSYENYYELIFRWLGVLIPMIMVTAKRHTLNSFEYTVFVGVLLGTLIYSSFFIFLHSSYGYRVSLYLEILFIVWFPSMISKTTRVGISTISVSSLVFYLCVFIYFFIGFMFFGFHGTLPLYFQVQ